MALTDKSMIPLSVSDLRVVEGKRCFLDRRLAQRLGYERVTRIRYLINRNKEDFESRFGNLTRRESNYPGAGRPTEEYLLTKGQALWVCRKSEARNADDVMEEIIKVFLAVDAGAPIPDTPFADAFLASDAPRVRRGDDGLTHIEPQPGLFDLPEIVPFKPPKKVIDPDECERRDLEKARARIDREVSRIRTDGIQGRLELDDETKARLIEEHGLTKDGGGHASFNPDEGRPGIIEQWHDLENGVLFIGTLRMTGRLVLSLHRVGSIASKTWLPTELPIVYGDGESVLVELGDRVPSAVLRRAYDRLPKGTHSAVGLASLAILD
jgi:hypothetical protein